MIGTEADDITAYRRRVYNMVADELMAMACNMVAINGLPQNIPADFVKRALLERGIVAFVRAENEISAYECSGTDGIDIYGYPRAYYLTPKNGGSFVVPANYDGLAVVRANAVMYPIYDAVLFAAGKIAECEVAISANLLHCQTTDFVETDEETAISIKTAIRQRNLGAPVVYTRKNIADAIRECSTSAIHLTGDYIADKIMDLRDRYMQSVLAKLGTLTANRYKKERVQSAEVNAGVGEVLDYLYTLCDHYNADVFGTFMSDTEMTINTTVEDLYTDMGADANV